MALSAAVVPVEGTLRPAFYVPAVDTLPDYEWVDDSVNGLVYVRQILVTDNAVYYFGDDASESTGTLSIMRYDLAPEFHKSPVSEKKELDRKKPVVKSKNVVRKKQIQKR